MSNKKTFEPIEEKCKDCGISFYITAEEQQRIHYKGYELPKRCLECRKKKREINKLSELKAKAEQEAIEKENKRIKHEKDEKKLAELLAKLPYSQVELSSVSSDKHTLIIIGNGFDLLHGAKSSYWDFQKTFGKNSELRFHLETYLQVEPDKLWYNFEDSLSHINAGAMLDVVDMWLDNFGVYDKKDSMAAYYGAIDAAFLPIEVLCHELPKRFRIWVETLNCDGTRPLKNTLSKDAIYLNFNYTDFLETLYGISHTSIKYIHGCRKKEKNKPKQQLVLGHVPNVDYLKEYKPTQGMVPKYKNRWKRAMLENAMDIGTQLWVTSYEETFTKHTPEIIMENQDFFISTETINKIIVIGHSLSEVDYPYFKEIVKANNRKATWIIGFHSYYDMIRLNRFVGEMEIPLDKVTVFKIT